MKKHLRKSLLFINICFCTGILNAAEVLKTVNVTTAGTLSENINSTEKSSITNLTVSGIMDARDFKYIRDALTALTSLNISAVEIAAYTGADGTASTLSTVYDAHKVPGRAFDGLRKITGVVLPNSIIEINDYAFRECRNLRTIVIPNSVVSIGKSVFYNCINLTGVTLSAELKTIGNSVFKYCGQLSTVTIPDKVTSIGETAFYACGVTEITVPSTVTILGEGIFGKCTALESATMLCDIPSIPEYLFTECTALKSFSIPQSVTVIKKGAFSGCTALTDVSIPNNLTDIEYVAFAACSTLISVNIPATVKSIDQTAFGQCSGYFNVDSNNQDYSSLDGLLYNKNKSILYNCPVSKSGDLQISELTETVSASAFLDCSLLTSITLPTALKIIESGAFAGCSALKTIYLPANLTSIGTLAFQSCREVTSVYSYAPVPVDLSKQLRVFSDIDKSACTLYVPSGSKSLYQAADHWKDFTNIVETSTFTDVNQAETDSIAVYPNPVTDGFTVSWSNGPATLSICDINGKKLLEKQISENTYLPAGNFSKGLYIVSITTANGATLTKKLVKH
jgi:hypothetical protein